MKKARAAPSASLFSGTLSGSTRETYFVDSVLRRGDNGRGRQPEAG
jgi:hypothetical protein